MRWARSVHPSGSARTADDRSVELETLGDFPSADSGNNLGVTDHDEEVGGAGHADVETLAGAVAGVPGGVRKTGALPV